jgi:MFS family permease
MLMQSAAKGNEYASEWKRHWPLPLVAMLGITGPAAYSYASGVFMTAMTGEFGWSRTEFSSAFTLQMLLGLFSVPVAGRILDKVGPRRMALMGIIPFTLILSCLGFANGNIWQWLMLSALLPIGTALVMPTIWITGVVRSFEAARGTALAISLAGIGVATAIWPLLAAYFIDAFGWRLAFGAIGLSYAAVILPFTWLLYNPAEPPSHADDASHEKESSEALPRLLPIFCSANFIGLLIAGGLFAFAQLGMIYHFAPLAQAQGLTLGEAAQVAAIVGIFSIIGRLGTGFLLDWLPLRPLAIGAFSLLLISIFLLFTADGSGLQLTAAAILLGLAAGCEMDVLTFVASRRFESRIFGSAYASLSVGLGIMASMGPLAAGKLFDMFGSYDRFLILAAMCDVIAIVAILIVLSPRFAPVNKAARASTPGVSATNTNSKDSE